MKIGLISINMYSKGLNFACPLHTYAFQQFLLANGIESTIIDYKPIYYDNFNLEHPSCYYEELIQKKESSPPKNLSAEEQKAFQEKLAYYKKRASSWAALYQEREKRYHKLQTFIETNYIKTSICYDSDLLEVLDPGFDCYICVTDVIWKNEPNYGFDRGFFLGSSCMEQKWKLAYAVSQGAYVAKSPSEKKLFFHYLSDLDALSVRETSLKNYIEHNSSLTAAHLLDPVLLNDASFYEGFLTKPQEEHYLLLYYVMEKAHDTIRSAVEYARNHRLRIIEITDHPIKGGSVSARYPDVECTFLFDIGIEEWLGYLRYADCIFTNSFHACCFSILFEKKFLQASARVIRSLICSAHLGCLAVACPLPAAILSCRR